MVVCLIFLWSHEDKSSKKIEAQQAADTKRREDFEKKLVGHKVVAFKTLQRWAFPKQDGYIKWYEVAFDTGDTLQFLVNDKGATRVLFETAEERAKPHVDETGVMGFPNETRE